MPHLAQMQAGWYVVIHGRSAPTFKTVRLRATPLGHPSGWACQAFTDALEALVRLMIEVNNSALGGNAFDKTDRPAAVVEAAG